MSRTLNVPVARLVAFLFLIVPLLTLASDKTAIEIVPEPRSMSPEVEVSARRDGSRVEADWKVRLSRIRFDPEAFPELRKFWNAASSETCAFSMTLDASK
jgi:hypothetical protein